MSTHQIRFAGSLALAIQSLEVITAALTFIRILLGFGIVDRDITAIFDAISFVVSIFPWALLLGYLDQNKYQIGYSTWLSIGSSLLLLFAACFSLTSLFIPQESYVEDEKTTLEEVLNVDAVNSHKKPRDAFLITIDSLADFSVLMAVASVVGLNKYQDASPLIMGARGCQIAVTLLAFDCAVLTALMRQYLIDVQMGAIVVAGLSLVGWITGIVGCSLIGVSTNEFGFPAACSLTSLLSSIVVFSVGIYLGLNYSKQPNKLENAYVEL